MNPSSLIACRDGGVTLIGGVPADEAFDENIESAMEEGEVEVLVAEAELAHRSVA